MKAALRTTLVALALAALPAQALAAPQSPVPQSDSMQRAIEIASAKPAPGPQLAPPQQERTASAGVEESCAELEAKLAQKSIHDEGLAACIKPAEHHEVTANISSLSARIAARTPTPLPDWCWENMAKQPGWWITRMEGCAAASWTLEIKELRTKKTVGEIYFVQVDHLYIPAKNPAWRHQTVIDITGGWGPIAGTYVTGDATCDGACTLPAADIDFPRQKVNQPPIPTNPPVWGSAIPATTVSAVGAEATAKATLYYQFHNPAWTVKPPMISSAPTFSVRCDHKLGPRAGIGCTIPDADPYFETSLTGPYPMFAQHVLEAQRTGLPGAPDAEVERVG